MKKLIALLLVITVAFTSCETSEGAKFGTLQKVSHKTFPCNYYEIQVAFQGGTSTGGDNPTFSNTQEIKIDQAAYDSLQSYVGEPVVFDYHDAGLAVCGSSKQLTFIRLKNPPTAKVDLPKLAENDSTTGIRFFTKDQLDSLSKIPTN